MASIIIHRIEFIDNNTFGTFVTGDILEVYLDTSLIIVPAFIEYTGVTVNLNGSPLASGPLIDSAKALTTNYTTQICSGTYLIVPGTSGIWPYGQYYSLADHYSCAINPPTCDLMVVGVPSVIPASDEVTADGSFIVVASSTNTIQYKLDSDFIYGDGSAQVTGEFTGLLKGQYRVYLRDSKNCLATVLVTVSFTNVYNTIYRLEYQDQNKNQTRIDITKRGYEDEIIEVCGSGNPFNIAMRGEGNNDKFEPLLSIQGDLELLSETDSQFIEFFTNDPNLYRMNYYKDLGIIQQADDPFLDYPFSGWTNEAGAGPDWTTGTNPSVVTTGTNSDNLITPFSGVPTPGTYDFNFDVDSTGNAVFAVKFFKSGVEISGGELNAIDIAAGNTTGTFAVSLSAIPDEVKTYARRVGFSGTPMVTLNSYSLDIPEISGLQKKWMGKVLPQRYEELFKAPPYYTKVIATDALAELQDHFLIQPDGNKYFGTISLIKLVALCLDVLKMDLDILVACNLYAETMSLVDAADPLAQSYIDFEAFYLGEKEPTLSFVLKSILEPFGARIVQWDNRWNIIRVEEFPNDFNYRLFDKDGEYLNNGTFAPVKELDFPSNTEDLLFVNADQNLEIRPGFGRLKVFYSLGLKPNIIDNGDFTLKSVYIPSANLYSFTLNKDSFVLVNAGYVLIESTQQIDKGNIAYVITGDADSTGEAYIQTKNYDLRMGTNNQIHILLRVKFPITIEYFGFPGSPLTEFKIEVPYIKLRVLVQYGSLYLTSNGTWTTDVNELVFFITEFNKFLDYEITANQPKTGTPTDGMDFNIRVYHTYAFWRQFENTTDLKAFPTYDSGTVLVANGYKTELYSTFFAGLGDVIYLELEENTDAEDIPNIIRPDDYHATNNPRQWIFKTRRPIALVIGSSIHSLVIDKIQVNYLTGGNDPIDTIVREAPGESANKLVYEKTFILGSYSTLIVTDVTYGISLGIFFPSTGGIATSITNILSAQLIYTGWLRDSFGNGFEFWARDGIAESDKLHGIALKSFAAQYKKSWRLFRGSLSAQGQDYFNFTNIWKNVNDSNRVFMPMGISLDDKKAIYSGEWHELIDIFADPGSDGSSESPYTSAFSTGYGADFN